jgi:hypothetical protein
VGKQKIEDRVDLAVNQLTWNQYLDFCDQKTVMRSGIERRRTGKEEGGTEELGEEEDSAAVCGIPASQS